MFYATAGFFNNKKIKITVQYKKIFLGKGAPYYFYTYSRCTEKVRDKFHFFKTVGHFYIKTQVFSPKKSRDFPLKKPNHTLL